MISKHLNIYAGHMPVTKQTSLVYLCRLLFFFFLWRGCWEVIGLKLKQSQTYLSEPARCGPVQSTSHFGVSEEWDQFCSTAPFPVFRLHWCVKPAWLSCNEIIINKACHRGMVILPFYSKTSQSYTQKGTEHFFFYCDTCQH